MRFILLVFLYTCLSVVASDQRLPGWFALLEAAQPSHAHVKAPSYTNLVHKGYGVMVRVAKKAVPGHVKCSMCDRVESAPYFIRHVIWEHRPNMEQFLNENPEFNSWRDSWVYIGMCNNADLEKRY